MSKQESEGVIKFELAFTSGKPVATEMLPPLSKWRAILQRFDWIGQVDNRYMGLGFGNMSRRVANMPEAFIISGTQTGYLSTLDASSYTLVTKADIVHNRIVATGVIPPSSEALTHAAIYQANHDVEFVFHVHAPELWQNWQKLGFHSVSEQIAYGTKEMAHTVANIFSNHGLVPIAMLGHDDGLISMGKNADEAGNMLLDAQQRYTIL